MRDLPRDWFAELLAKFVPPAWHARTVVAGGFAANPQRANDIDLWLLAGDRFFAARAAVLQMMRTNKWDHYLVGDEAGYSPEHHLILNLPNAAYGLAVQVLVSDQSDAQGLVDSFDISTHAVAKWQQNDVMKCVYTTLGVDSPNPTVLRFTTPTDTLRRLEKLCARYGLVPNAVDVRRLEWAEGRKQPLRTAA